MERFAPGRPRRGAGAAGPGPPTARWSSPSAASPTARTPSACCRRFARVRAVRPDARLAFVGDGPLAARGGRRARARLGLDGRGHPRRAPSRTSAVADWVAACDMLAIVSRVEPLGVAALEALAGGRPVVATRVGRHPRGGARPGRRARGQPRWTRRRSPAAILARPRRPPVPEACRAAAEPHALDGRPAKVAAILRAGRRERGLRRAAGRAPTLRYSARPMPTTDAPARPAAPGPARPAPAVVAVRRRRRRGRRVRRLAAAGGPRAGDRRADRALLRDVPMRRLAPVLVVAHRRWPPSPGPNLAAPPAPGLFLFRILIVLLGLGLVGYLLMDGRLALPAGLPRPAGHPRRLARVVGALDRLGRGHARRPSAGRASWR